MSENDSPSGLIVYTIGHSNHEPDRFLELLTTHRIETVVDVRSSPYSRYVTQFNREALACLLSSSSIDYQYFGSHLGGKPNEPEFYDADGRVLYRKLAESERFQEGISRLMELIRYSRVAIMCSEEDPSECHRRRLITRVLEQRGVAVNHIRGDGSVISEQELSKNEQANRDRGQLSMFGSTEVEECEIIS